MQIQLRFFASLREALGVSAEQLTLPDGAATAHDVLAHLRRRGGAWAEVLGPDRAFKVAVDQRLAELSSQVRNGAELAFFPPVTGG